MKYTRGLLLGLAVGILIGLILFLRSQRLREELGLEGYLSGPRVHAPERESPRPAAAPPAPAARPKRAAAPTRDRLEKIHGIGPVYARRLNAAGVNTFADLAALTPAQVVERIGATRLPIDPAAWITEARSLQNG